jgi:hypothetical protein
MNYKRALGIGILMFIASLVINAVATISLGIDLKEMHPKELPAVMWFVAVVSIIFLSLLGSLWYFKSKNTLAGLFNGFKLGLFIVGLAIVLDIVALVFYENGASVLLGYFSHPLYWLTLALIATTTSSVGHLKAKK